MIFQKMIAEAIRQQDRLSIFSFYQRYSFGFDKITTYSDSVLNEVLESLESDSSNTLEDALEYFEGIEVRQVIWSQYFQDNFDSEEQYGEAVQRIAPEIIFSLVRGGDTLRTDVLLLDEDLEEIASISIEYGWGDGKQEKVERELEDIKESLRSAIEEVERVKDMAVEFFEHMEATGETNAQRAGQYLADSLDYGDCAAVRIFIDNVLMECGFDEEKRDMLSTAHNESERRYVIEQEQAELEELMPARTEQPKKASRL